MDIQLNCSEELVEKIHRLTNKSEISISDNARIALVERGFQVPSGKVAIVFDPIDYVEAVQLLLKDTEFGQPGPEIITGFSNNRYSLVPIRDVYHIDAEGSEVTCYLNKETCCLKNTLSYYERTLGSHGIVRINKSQLAGLVNVREIIPWFGSRLVLVMKNNQELEVSKHYAKALRKTLDM